MTFTDAEGKSVKQKITDRRHNDFDRGKPVTLPLELTGIGKVSAITIHRDDNDEEDNW